MLSTQAVSEYLKNTHNRDNIMATAAFVPMMLAQPVGKVTGRIALAESLVRLSTLADGYRTVTRLSGLFDVCQVRNVASIASIPNPLVRNMSVLEMACSLGFFPSEHLALFTKFGVLFNGEAARFKHFSTLAVFFWFWGLVLKTVRLTLMMIQKRNQIAAGGGNNATTVNEKKKLRDTQLRLVGALSYLIFSMTCVGQKTRLFYGPTNVVTAPVNALFETLSPPRLELPLWVRGFLGVVASSVEYYL